MKLVNETIPVDDRILSFSHTAWDEAFSDQEYISQEELEDFEAINECKTRCFTYEDDWDDDNVENLYDSDFPLKIWSLEMNLNENVLLGYYETLDGYIQVWATENTNE